jgi:hypothetical protein
MRNQINIKKYLAYATHVLVCEKNNHVWAAYTVLQALMMVFLGVAGIHSAIALSHDGMCRQRSHNLASIAFFFFFFFPFFSSH